MDQGGAEQLLGHGDMLYLPPGTALPVRVHGAFVSDEEVHRVVSDWKKRGAPEYQQLTLASTEWTPDGVASASDAEQDDPLYDEAVSFVLESRRASISAVQRKLRIGYNRAARLVEAMEAAGVVSAMNSNGSRELLVPERE
jgi:S-DNA-T family DNA segregation ATPase FtsK/SpoIIIE